MPLASPNSRNNAICVVVEFKKELQNIQKEKYSHVMLAFFGCFGILYNEIVVMLTAKIAKYFVECRKKSEKSFTYFPAECHDPDERTTQKNTAEFWGYISF